VEPHHRFITLPVSVPGFFISEVWASPIPSGLAVPTGRIEFVIILRAGNSPPVALHPSFLKRSYSQLQAGESLPEEDFHLSDLSRFWAH